MSLWQFAACVAGWKRGQGVEEAPPALSNAEFDDMLERNAAWIAQQQ